MIQRSLVAAAFAAVAMLTACSTTADPTPTILPLSPSPSLTSSPTPSPTARPTPNPSPTPTEAGTYLALGDSLAVGVGATQPTETGYVARIHSALSEPAASPRVTSLSNLAVSGETSTSMIRTGQLAAALDVIAGATPRVTVVTLDIGGNDLLRLLGTETCAAEPMGQDCLQLLALTLEDFEANYRQIVGELIEALDAHSPGARLAAMTYFNPFSGTDAAYEAAGHLALVGSDGRLECDTADPRARGMNDIIACVADELGAIGVDIQPAFEGLGLELTHIGSQDIHANDRGYELIAGAFVTALGDS